MWGPILCRLRSPRLVLATTGVHSRERAPRGFIKPDVVCFLVSRVVFKDVRQATS